jgi:hypothetical protein
MVVELPEFITPVLECYQEFNNGPDRGLHQDTSSVTDLHIRSDWVIEWARFPRLTRVTVQKLSQSFATDCARLKDNPRHCPHLSHILFLIQVGISQSILGEVRQHLNDCSHSTGRMITFETKSPYHCNDTDRPSYDKVRAFLGSKRVDRVG